MSQQLQSERVVDESAATLGLVHNKGHVQGVVDMSAAEVKSIGGVPGEGR